MRQLVAVGCVFLALAFTAMAGDVDGKKVVGKWTMKKGEDTGHVEFTKDGKLHITHSKDGKEIKMDGTYEISKDKITVHFEKDGKKETKMGTIEKLTADTLIIESSEGEKMEFHRAKKKAE